MCMLRSRIYLQISQPLWHLQAIRTICATILSELSSGYAIDKDSKVQCICESCRKGFCLSLLNPRCKDSTFRSHSVAALLYCDRHSWGGMCSVQWPGMSEAARHWLIFSSPRVQLQLSRLEWHNWGSFEPIRPIGLYSIFLYWSQIICTMWGLKAGRMGEMLKTMQTMHLRTRCLPRPALHHGGQFNVNLLSSVSSKGVRQRGAFNRVRDIQDCGVSYAKSSDVRAICAQAATTSRHAPIGWVVWTTRLKALLLRLKVGSDHFYAFLFLWFSSLLSWCRRFFP